MKKRTSILLSIRWAIVILVFPVLSGVIVTVFEMDQIQTFITQGSFMLISLVIPIIYILKKKINIEKLGIRSVEKRSVRKVLYFIPLLFAEIPLIFTGVSSNGFIYYIALTFFTLAVGISEEVYFRGIILQLLQGSFTPKKTVMISALIFGIGHIANILTGGNLLAVFLQIANAVIFGIVTAEVVLITKSLVPVIAWHTISNFVNNIISASGTNEIIAIIIQETILIIYIFYLWNKISFKHNR